MYFMMIFYLKQTCIKQDMVIYLYHLPLLGNLYDKAGVEVSVQTEMIDYNDFKESLINTSLNRSYLLPN